MTAKKTSKKASSKPSPKSSPKRGVNPKRKSKESPPSPAPDESSSTPNPSSRPSSAARDLFEQAIRFAPHVNPGSIYKIGNPFVACEEIRRHLDGGAHSHKEKMFILKCLTEYYQAREDKEDERKTSGSWSAKEATYSGLAFVDARPDAWTHPDHGGQKR